MKRANVVAATGFLALAGLFLFESRKLSFGTLRLPHTGFFPKILIILLIVLTVICLIHALRDGAVETGPEKIPTQGWIRIGATLAILVGFALVLEALGFLASTFLLMLLLLRAVDAPPWPRVVVIALLSAVLAYGTFSWLLGVPLPHGVWGF